MPHYSYELQYLKTAPGPIAGVDEAGRGPLAGPVVAAAVILDRTNASPRASTIPSSSRAEAREELFPHIMDMRHCGRRRRSQRR